MTTKTYKYQSNGIWNRSYCEYQSCRHLGLSGRPRVQLIFYSKNNPRVLWLKYRLYRFNFDGRYRVTATTRFGNLQPFLRFHNGGYRLYQKSTIYLHSCRTKTRWAILEVQFQSLALYVTTSTAYMYDRVTIEMACTNQDQFNSTALYAYKLIWCRYIIAVMSILPIMAGMFLIYQIMIGMGFLT